MYRTALYGFLFTAICSRSPPTEHTLTPLHRRRAEHKYGARVLIEGKGGIREALGVRVAEADCHEQGTLPSLGVATVQQYTPSQSRILVGAYILSPQDSRDARIVWKGPGSSRRRPHPLRRRPRRRRPRPRAALAAAALAVAALAVAAALASPSPPPVPTFEVVSGSCTVKSDRCVYSDNFGPGQKYSDNQDCVIKQNEHSRLTCAR
eukprot:scaffold59639_cov69-Phaeocystis_antarctica.AAC.1